jgi:hypothetical protein
MTKMFFILTSLFFTFSIAHAENDSSFSYIQLVKSKKKNKRKNKSPQPPVQQPIEISNAKLELNHQYELASRTPSDINEHLCELRSLAQECSSVVEIGLRTMVSSWGILMGLSESRSVTRSYLGIDIESPPVHVFRLVSQLAQANNILFNILKANDMDIDIVPTEMLFIDSLHTYCHLTYELEKFSPQVRKYIAVHDTSAPWGNMDEPAYRGDFSEYPLEYDRTKRGLWPAVEDFLERHPEWILLNRYHNNHGFTILKRIDQ